MCNDFNNIIFNQFIGKSAAVIMVIGCIYGNGNQIKECAKVNHLVVLFKIIDRFKCLDSMLVFLIKYFFCVEYPYESRLAGYRDHYALYILVFQQYLPLLLSYCL